MSSVRRIVAFEKWRELKTQKIISIHDIEDMMYAIEKLLMNYDTLEKSRDNWKAKYHELKEEMANNGNFTR